MSTAGFRYYISFLDDFSRFTWVIFLRHKSDAFNEFLSFFRKLKGEEKDGLKTIRTDHGGEFDNTQFEDFCKENGVSHQFSAPRTPEQNGVVERKNMILIEMARTMLTESGMARIF